MSHINSRLYDLQAVFLKMSGQGQLASVGHKIYHESVLSLVIFFNCKIQKIKICVKPVSKLTDLS